MGSEFRNGAVLEEISSILANRIPYIDSTMIADSSKRSRVLWNINRLNWRLKQTSARRPPSWLNLMEITCITFRSFAFVAACHIIFVRPPVPSKIPDRNLPRSIARNNLVTIAPQRYWSHRRFHIETARVSWIPQVPQFYCSILASTV